MKCHRCGSTDHLVAQCPKGKGKGGKKGKGRSYWEEGETWENDDLVQQYEFSYMNYTEELYGPTGRRVTASQVTMQHSSRAASSSVIPETASEQGTPPCRKIPLPGPVTSVQAPEPICVRFFLFLVCFICFSVGVTSIDKRHNHSNNLKKR